MLVHVELEFQAVMLTQSLQLPTQLLLWPGPTQPRTTCSGHGVACSGLSLPTSVNSQVIPTDTPTASLILGSPLIDSLLSDDSRLCRVDI